MLNPLPDEVIVPDAADTATAAPATEPGINTMTLQKAVEQLNKKASALTEDTVSSAPKAHVTFHASVDEAVAHKTVTLIGAKTTSPFVLLNAFSQVYGLRVMPQKDNALFLTLRSPRPCKQFADVPQELRRLFPEPIWRAVESGAQRYENSDEEQAIKKREDDMRSHLSEAQIKANAPYYEALAKQGQTRMRLRSAEALNVEAIRRLRILVQPQVPKNSGKRLPVVEVGEEAHQALAIIHLTQAAEELDSLLTNPVPPFLLHFNRAWVQAIVGTPDGPDAAACHLGTFDEEGIVQSSSSSFFRMTPQ